MEREKNQDFILDFSVIFTKCNLNKTFRTISKGVMLLSAVHSFGQMNSKERNFEISDFEFSYLQQKCHSIIAPTQMMNQKEPETLEPKFILLY